MNVFIIETEKRTCIAAAESIIEAIELAIGETSGKFHERNIVNVTSYELIQSPELDDADQI